MQSFYPYVRLVSSVATILMVALATGCSKTPISGVFVDKVSPTEIVMVRMVESPPGHLMGSIASTAVTRNGSTRSHEYNVMGTINGPNVSLQIGTGMAGLGRFLEARTILVGNLRGHTLTLSRGNSTAEFQEVSDGQYQNDLAALNVVAQHTALVLQSTKSLLDAASYDRRVNLRLQSYLMWGQARINRVPDVRRWYANRISQYARCLAHIAPLAAARVPEWRWQECVLSVENDKYYRDQEAANFRAFWLYNQKAVGRINGSISSATTQFAEAVRMLRSSCPYRKPNSRKCMALVRKLQTLGSSGLINKELLAEFRAIVPKVRGAIEQDIATGSAGEAKLSGIARRVVLIYRAAWKK